MRLQFTEAVAAPTWSYPRGAVIDVPELTPDLQRWLEAGVVRPLRTPDETPEGRQAPLETRGVPKLCHGGTVVCLGGGPSLTPEDVDFCRGKATVIAVNDAYKLAPWADVLYACDEKWWTWHQGVPDFAGLKFALAPCPAGKFPNVTVLKNTGDHGVDLNPEALRNGKNSGYQAINVAVHLGASRIVLLGYDMQWGPKQRSHWFGEHPNKIKPPVHGFIAHFAALVDPLQALGIAIVNCSRTTALTCFPTQPIDEVLA